MSTACTPKIKKNEAEQKQPNTIVIFADDLGYGDIGCYGAEGIKTPELDGLAADGFRSTDFFIPANVCSPSRAALLTGRYPMRNGYPVASNVLYEKYDNYGFAPDELSIPEVLKPAGYHTLMVGKWHLGMWEEALNFLGPESFRHVSFLCQDKNESPSGRTKNVTGC